ncbi:MAG: NifB/NifX family molybdenum-iron cluster-binding protein, partial [Phycisphaerae bacterium]
DTAGTLLVAEMEGGRVTGRRREPMDGDLPSEKVARLKALGVETLVCGAISRPLAGMIAAEGIRLVPFVAGTVEEVVAAYAQGLLPGPTFAMPGCGRRRRGRFGRGRGGGGRGRNWGFHS